MPEEEDTTMIVFSNAKSGGGRGAEVLKELGAVLGKEKVFDLGSVRPEEVLERVEAKRIIVCGGDGTMTWIMAAIDTINGDLSIVPMPLGTGNDLARSFGWGGRFKRSFLTRKWLREAQEATPAALDRWLCCVMPSSSGDETLPDVFSVHEYEASVNPTHRVVSRGLHYSDTTTGLSKHLLAGHDAVMRGIHSFDQFFLAHQQPSIPEEEDLSPSSRSETAFSEHGGSDDEIRKEAMIASHVAPSESVLETGATWRSYDGTFSNYLSLGLDAAGAFAFHDARRKNPKRFSSRIKNQLLYAYLGLLKTGGYCCCEKPPPLLTEVATVLCRDSPTSDWRTLHLPSNARGLIILTLQSYAGGRNLWGRTNSDKWRTPDVADGLLEVVTISNVFNFAAQLSFGGRWATRVVQAAELRLRLTTPVYMQMDGEPWYQSPATVHLKAIGRSTVLRHQ